MTISEIISSTMWRRCLTYFLLLLIYQYENSIAAHNSYSNNNQNFKITPKPCNVNGYDGTCMFVWECMKSEGQHVGICVDLFMFGSCCSHNLTDNVVLPQTTQTMSYHPNKPNKTRPPPTYSNKPIITSGSTTYLRPHGGGQIVVRPSGTQTTFQSSGYSQRPMGAVVSTTTKLTTRPPPRPLLSSSSSQLSASTENETDNNDLTASASISTAAWSTHSFTTQWQVTTQPNFITKPRPSPWDKTTPSRPKPKPTKKPILADRPMLPSPTILSTRKPTTVKPKPQIFQPKPTKPLPTTTKTFTTKSTTLDTDSASLTSSSSVKPSSTTTSSSSTSSSSTTTTTTSTSTKQPTTLSTTVLPPPTVVSASELSSLSSTTAYSMPTSSFTPPSNRNISTLSAARGIECGIPTMVARPETRIVGGKNAPFGRWPWQVSVRRTSFFGFSSTHRCGGAIINENWIATAGHCVDDLLTSQIRIRVGEYDFSHVQEQLPYTERAVSKKIVHPKYNFFTYEYDLALVKLETPLEFAPHISPICLPATDDLLIGENATVTGWGRLSEGGTLPSVLQEVSVPIVSNDRCKSMFLRAGRHEFIPEIFLCAGHETGGHDSCQGDSGGPLQVKAKDGRYFLAGIISWGIGCAEANLPGVCTRISKFVPWILENVNSVE